MMTTTNIDSVEMLELIQQRGETPTLVAADDDTQLFRFPDGTEVLLTNAGVVTDDEYGFAVQRALVAGMPIYGEDAIRYAEGRGLLLNKSTDPTEEAREGVSVEEAREIARQDADLIWIDVPAVACQCGRWSGVPCAETVHQFAAPGICPEHTAVTVEYMPEHLRESHRAAGNRGVWPQNGAERITCCPECAEFIADEDADWASIVD